MSNIPFNTVSSVLITGGVAGQLSAVQDKKMQERIRGQRALAAATVASQEEVDDPGNHEIQHVHDEDRRSGDGEPHSERRNGEEQVEIEGIEVTGAASAETPVEIHLDISA